MNMHAVFFVTTVWQRPTVVRMVFQKRVYGMTKHKQYFAAEVLAESRLAASGRGRVWV
jgi:arginine/ornithine N-succinyltransferase beta subunit